MNPLDPQPPPTPAAGDVWADLIPNLPDILQPYATERRAQGIERYGTPLQVDNGRDHLLDLFQEELDRIAYLRAYMMQAEQAILDAIPRVGRSGPQIQWYAERALWAAGRLDKAIADAAATAREIAVVKAGAP